jgi:hypothetical protein
MTRTANNTANNALRASARRVMVFLLKYRAYYLDCGPGGVDNSDGLDPS